jgi:hypothetical protein
MTLALGEFLQQCHIGLCSYVDKEFHSANDLAIEIGRNIFE